MSIHQLPTKQAMTGITLSFTLNHETSQGDKVAAQMHVNAFAKAVADLQKQGFPTLKHTLISRQEYEP